EPNSEILRRAKKFGHVDIFRDPKDAVKDADIIYTDVWASMGQEAEREKRLKIFRDYQVNEGLVSISKDAIVMHCLPAHRGEEITDEVIESERSVVFDQAENRLHAQKAILLKLIS
ncbi:MAG: ornithine carbamoyltransferase, partial [Archaeoglobaceae archaeon]